MTKITLKMCDIEVSIEGSSIPDNELIPIANGEMEFLLQSRVTLQQAFDAEPAEDSQGEKPTHAEHPIKPDITMAHIYA